MFKNIFKIEETTSEARKKQAVSLIKEMEFKLSKLSKNEFKYLGKFIYSKQEAFKYYGQTKNNGFTWVDFIIIECNIFTLFKRKISLKWIGYPNIEIDALGNAECCLDIPFRKLKNRTDISLLDLKSLDNLLFNLNATNSFFLKRYEANENR